MEQWKIEKGALKKIESFDLPFVSGNSVGFLLFYKMEEPFSGDNWQLLANGNIKPNYLSAIFMCLRNPLFCMTPVSPVKRNCGILRNLQLSDQQG